MSLIRYDTTIYTNFSWQDCNGCRNVTIGNLKTGSIYWNFWQDFKNGNFELCCDLGSHIYFAPYTKFFPATPYRIVTPNIKEETKFSASLPLKSRSRAQHRPFPVPGRLQGQTSHFLCLHVQIFFAQIFQTNTKIKTTSEPFLASPTSTHIKLMKSRSIYTQTLFIARG